MAKYDLDGKTLVVTGGASGIGKAIVTLASQNGASVIIADVDEERGSALERELKNGGSSVLFVKTDVTDYDSVSNCLARSIEAFGKVDVLINNAGWDRFSLFLKKDRNLWKKIVDINLYGVLNCTRVFGEHMVSNNTGSIVNVASDAGRNGSLGEAVYSACKGGVIAFTKTMAREFARFGIRVNVVCPGLTETPLLDAMMQDDFAGKVMQAIRKATPLGRFGKPEEVAHAVLFFASDAASFITGQVLSVSGGLTMAG